MPNVTIADVLQLKQMQRFDLIAVPATILEERKASASMHIADVRLVDGSKQTDSTADPCSVAVVFKILASRDVVA